MSPPMLISGRARESRKPDVETSRSGLERRMSVHKEGGKWRDTGGREIGEI